MKTTIQLVSAFVVAAVLYIQSNCVVAGEVPSLVADVEAGKLPPKEQRLPETPRVIDLSATNREIGRHGGDLNLLMGKVRDIRQMVVYGYARLVGFDQNLKLVPDVLESYEVEGERSFTFHLRPGHKWSDGHPFTTEDFRYYWEDVVNNKDLSPFGPSKALLVDGQPPVVNIIDEYTIQYTWPAPNPYFLTALAGARPLFIYEPAHYMKQFHANYLSEEELAAKVKKAGTRNWAGLHVRMARMYKATNPGLPTLQPWYNTVEPPSDRFLFERNPYFHRVDEEGNQLPYIDRVIVNIASSSLVAAKTGAGDTDLQARYLSFADYTFLKEGEERNDYTVRLWRRATGSRLALYPNLNTNDEVWREVLQDARFRRALSLAIDRQEINQVIYYGLVTVSNNTILSGSPLFKPEYQNKWTEFDIDKANALLDEMGLSERNSKGLRLLPDGRPIEIIIQSAGESTEESDILELIHDTWVKIGVKLYTRPSQREVFRNRVFSGESIMAVWSGIENGIPTAEMSPGELAPSIQQQLQWPKWGKFYETSGQSGEEPTMTSVLQLARLNDQWVHADSNSEREKIWHEMLNIHTDEMFTIGTVCGVPQPIVVSNRLRNVPQEGLYNWEPGAYFGIYQPDTFWFDE
ncbi:MAG: ABC transporter substrate-binding protein [Arenicellales bacterium]|nr:ABC transporter substrate-binding protein [Arenicellales bacterium]